MKCLNADMQEVTVVIPCRNEADSIAQVIGDFRKSTLVNRAFDFDILVVDNNSTDDTAAVAARAGARVIHESRRGKGYAMRTGFRNISPGAAYVVMLDGDSTYKSEEVLRLLEPIHHNFCDVVVGSRLGGKMYDDSMALGNRGFNWLCVFLVRLFYRANVTDALSGYYAWKREVIDTLLQHLRASGFALEMEMITRMARLKYEMYSVPISYHKRTAGAGIRPLDSLPILQMFVQNLHWSPRSPSLVKVSAEKQAET
jgi:glycosyltransferase involved in cell wall biosynthesis